MTFWRQIPNCGCHERGYQRSGGFDGQHAEEKVANKDNKQSRDKKDKSVDSAFVYEDVFSKYDYCHLRLSFGFKVAAAAIHIVLKSPILFLE